MLRVPALLLVAMVAVGCSPSQADRDKAAGDKAVARLAPTSQALREVPHPVGSTTCTAAESLGAELCWRTPGQAPAAAAGVRAALTTAGATDLVARCGALGPRRVVRCAVTGAFQGNRLDVATEQHEAYALVLGFAALQDPPDLLVHATPVPVDGP